MSEMGIASRVLDLLKASAWQTGMLGLAGLAMLWMSSNQYIRPLDGAWYNAIVIFTSICVALTCASIGPVAKSSASTFYQVIHRRRAQNKQARELAEYIPYMTPKERQILAYLVEKKQKTFEADRDGGYAVTLISRGIVRLHLVHGQAIVEGSVPFTVPDHLYAELERNREQLKYVPEFSDSYPDIEMEPWRIPWMAR